VVAVLEPSWRHFLHRRIWDFGQPLSIEVRPQLPVQWLVSVFMLGMAIQVYSNHVNIDSAERLPFLRMFTTVETLHISGVEPHFLRYSKVSLGVVRNSRGPRRQRVQAAGRATLPALTRFEFTGENEGLEALVAQIDTPQVEVVEIWYRTPEVKTRQLSQFIDRTARLSSLPGSGVYK
jgi:hypothetical protein